MLAPDGNAVLLAAAVVVALTVPGWTSGPHGAIWDAEQLRAGLLRSHASLRSVHIVYRVTTDAADALGLGARQGTYIHREFAAIGPRSFFKINAHGDDEMDWRNDPILARSVIVNDVYRTEWTNRRTYEQRKLAPREPLPEKFQGDLFVLATGWWPPDSQWEPPRSYGRPISVHEVAAASEYCVVRPVLEQIDGRWCHVLERPGHDSIWIDTERGCAVMGREFREPGSGALIETYTLGGHREISDGIWLPSTFHWAQYDVHARTAQGRARVTGRCRATVVNVSVNDVPDKMFAFQSHPGDAICDRFNGNWEQTVSGGLDLLDLAAGNAKLMARRDERSIFDVGWAAGVPIFAAALLCFLYSRLRHRVGARGGTVNGAGDHASRRS